MAATNNVRPGKHPSFRDDDFSTEEKLILRSLESRWYLTNSGRTVRIGASAYRYILIKPTSDFTNSFGLERELCLLFSPYPNFEPRTLDAFDTAKHEIPGVRIDPICRILVSKDTAIESKVSSLLSQEPEQPIIVPFTYSDLLSDTNGEIEFNRFRSFFFSRDLFSVQSPLRKDTFFFGRTKLVQELTDRFKSGENSGLFGLRKSGKTSVIYSIQRWAQENSQTVISMDCESPSIHGLRWHQLLGQIVRRYHDAKQSQIKKPLAEYTDACAADDFSRDMLAVYRSKKAAPALLVFDEIERICSKTGSSPHWASADDFVYFWQSIRAFIQEHPGVINFLIVGTNPQSVELSKIGTHDNPLFALVPPGYVPCFNYAQTKEMIDALSGHMGLKFNPLVLAAIQRDFGGHPFLTRQICSHIHKQIKGQRPAEVDQSTYDAGYKSFLKLGAPYLGMVVDVLKEQYKDEYDLLLYLAQGKVADYQALSSLFQVNHLEGYGLVEQQAQGPVLTVNAVREHLLQAHKYEAEITGNSDRRNEINARSGALEIALRGLIRRSLRAIGNEASAFAKTLDAIPSERREKLKSYSYKELLKDEGSPLFLLDLKNIISREWDTLFKNIFPIEKDRVLVYLDEINEMRRAPAHSNAVAPDEFLRWRGTIKQFETWIDAAA